MFKNPCESVNGPVLRHKHVFIKYLPLFSYLCLNLERPGHFFKQISFKMNHLPNDCTKTIEIWHVRSCIIFHNNNTFQLRTATVATVVSQHFLSPHVKLLVASSPSPALNPIKTIKTGVPPTGRGAGGVLRSINPLALALPYQIAVLIIYNLM